MKTLVLLAALVAQAGANTVADNTSQGVIRSDAFELALRKGVTVEDASHRIARQQRFAELADRFAEVEGFVDATVISLADGDQLHLRFTQKGIARALASPALRDQLVAPFIQIDTAPVERLALEKLRKDAIAVLSMGKVESSTYVDGEEGKVVIESRSPGTTATLLRSVEGSDNLRFERRDRFPQPVANLLGGRTIATGGSRCTSAFGVISGLGTKGILTAAHCVKSTPSSTPSANLALYTGPSAAVVLTVQAAVWDATRDFAWAAGSGHVGVNQLYDGTSNRAITSVFTGAVPNGTQLCKFGISTGYTCQEVVNNNYIGVDAAGNTVGPLVELGGTSANIAQCGDSGGPIFAGNIAYGVTSRGDANGQCSGGPTLLYAPLSGIGAMNIAILTS